MTCSIEECERETVARGWCLMHWKRWWRNGDPTALVRRPRLQWPATLLDRQEPGENGCSLYTGAVTPRGYGMVWDGERSVQAHRASYEYHVGSIPEGMVIDHLCRTPLCVNPLHLEVVTIRENTARGNAPWAVVHRGHRVEANMAAVPAND